MYAIEAVIIPVSPRLDPVNEAPVSGTVGAGVLPHEPELQYGVDKVVEVWSGIGVVVGVVVVITAPGLAGGERTVASAALHPLC